jgi:hypothetical protein
MTMNKPDNGAELFAEDLSALEIVELPSDAALASFGTLSSGSSASCPSSASSVGCASSYS